MTEPKKTYQRTRGVSVNPAKITELRINKGWTPAELAQRVGVTPDAVVKWERGDRRPGEALALKLAKALGLKKASDLQ